MITNSRSPETPTRTSSAGLPARADAEAMAMLNELVALGTRMNEMSELVYRQLAARPTVNAHVGMARSHLAQLRRTLAHAEGVLTYNISRPG